MAGCTALRQHAAASGPELTPCAVAVRAGKCAHLMHGCLDVSSYEGRWMLRHRRSSSSSLKHRAERTSCMPALMCPPVSHSSCLPACSSRQPRGMATGTRLPSRSHTKSPGKRLLPCIVKQFKSCEARASVSEASADQTISCAHLHAAGVSKRLQTAVPQQQSNALWLTSCVQCSQLKTQLSLLSAMHQPSITWRGNGAHSGSLQCRSQAAHAPPGHTLQGSTMVSLDLNVIGLPVWCAAEE